MLVLLPGQVASKIFYNEINPDENFPDYGIYIYNYINPYKTKVINIHTWPKKNLLTYNNNKRQFILQGPHVQVFIPWTRHLPVRYPCQQCDGSPGHGTIALSSISKDADSLFSLCSKTPMGCGPCILVEEIELG